MVSQLESVELLDGDHLSATEADTALGDLARVQRYLFGLHALWSGVRSLLDGVAGERWLLDVGCGSGEAAQALVERARRRGARVRAITVDRKLTHLLRGRRLGLATLGVVADARALPFHAGCVDWACSNLLFHHFDGPSNLAVLGEMRRVARSAVVVADLRPSRLAAGLFRLLARILRFGPVGYSDGCTSLRRAWALPAVRELTRGLPVRVLRKRAPFRWTMVVGSGE